MIPLDPFAFQPGIASRIAGLQSGELGNNPDYIFHTDYATVGRGKAHAHIVFTGLRAKLGTLYVRIHMVTAGDAMRLVLVNTARIAFVRLVENGGVFVIPFEAFNGCRYAVYGSLLGDTDAEAESLTVFVEPPEDEEPIGLNTEARNSGFGGKAIRAVSHLVSVAAPSMDHPVSQSATLSQIRSGAARRWFDELHIARPDTLQHWSMVYTLQSLRAYGMLSAGARGLALGSAAAPVTDVLQRKGCDIVHGGADRSDGGIGALDMPQIGHELVNFDFLWAWMPEAVGLHADSIQRALTALLPGGLAILTFDFDPRSTLAMRTDNSASRRLSRVDIDRFALILISRHHEVAQMKVVTQADPLLHENDPEHSAFGLIVRRSLLLE